MLMGSNMFLFGQKTKKSVLSISILGIGYENKYFTFYENGNLKSYSTSCKDSSLKIACLEIYNFNSYGQILSAQYGDVKEFYTYNLNNQLYKLIIVNNSNDTTDIITHTYGQNNKIEKSIIQEKSNKEHFCKYDTTLLLFYTFSKSDLTVSYFDNVKKETVKTEKLKTRFNSNGLISEVTEFDSSKKIISTFKIDNYNNSKGRIRYYNKAGTLVYTKYDFVNPPLSIHQFPYQEKFLKIISEKHYPKNAKISYKYY